MRLERGNNPEYWINKIQRNIQRDLEKDHALQYLGWTVIHFWGKDILSHTDDCIQVIEEAIWETKMNNYLDRTSQYEK